MSSEHEEDATHVFHELSSIMEEMDGLNEESERLRSDVRFTRAEVERLRALVEAAAHELATTQADVEDLALRREEGERVAPNATVYANIQQAEEENRALELEIETRSMLKLSILKEAGDAAVEVENMKLDIERAARGNTNNDAANAVADPVVAYIKHLEEAVIQQTADLHRIQFHKAQLEHDEATMDANERQILHLRQELDACGLDVPIAPVVHRSNHLRRRRERTAASGGGPNADAFTAPSGLVFMANNLKNQVTTSAGGQQGSTSLIRALPPSGSIEGGAWHQHHPTAAGQLRGRSFEVPCGWLLPLTTILGPIRKIAAEYQLQRAQMGTQALDTHVVWGAQTAGASSSGRLQRGPATYLQCFGGQMALDRFEQQFLNAMDKASLLVSRYDGLVTYTQSFGAQQQDDTARKLMDVVSPSADRIASRPSPSGIGCIGGSKEVASDGGDTGRNVVVMAIPSEGPGHHHATPLHRRSVNVQTNTPMTIAAETPDDRNPDDAEDEQPSRSMHRQRHHDEERGRSTS